MQHIKVCLILAAALFLASTAPPASAEPPKSIVLVHGAWVDASAWKPVSELLTGKGFRVSMVQEPETSFAADVTAAKRVLDLQDGPTLLVGHSYGGSSITEAGVHTIVVGFVFVAARTLPMSKRTRVRWERRRRAFWPRPRVPSRRRRTASLISTRRSFPSCLRPICRASGWNL